ncbi:glycosyltransferase family 4 protein [Vibrio vulnificus]|nr:glycosyltransferase family 4 protein [Vibrio vulnificus]
MKGLLVSINSIGELTGGGLYARTLYSEFSANYRKFDVICKIADVENSANTDFINGSVIELSKSLLSDLVSRFLLSPTFLMTYFFKILIQAREYDIIHFHSSRNIPLAILVKFLLRKRVIVHFDNIEYKLSLKLCGFSPLILLRLYDACLLYVYEKFLWRILSSESSFITSSDRLGLKYYKASIIPIRIKSPFSSFTCDLIKNRSKMPYSLIFVASFSHSPNIQAFLQVLKIAEKFPMYNFNVVGRHACFLKYDKRRYRNVIVHSDVPSEKLDELYRSSHISLNLVSDGGGMKTKIAEAMSYTLPVICHPHSTIGYEEVLSNPLILQVESDDDIKIAIENILGLYTVLDLKLFNNYWDDFFSNYMIK